MNTTSFQNSNRFAYLSVIDYSVPCTLGWSINNKHRFTLHWTSKSSESLTSKVTWHMCLET